MQTKNLIFLQNDEIFSSLYTYIKPIFQQILKFSELSLLNLLNEIVILSIQYSESKRKTFHAILYPYSKIPVQQIVNSSFLSYPIHCPIPTIYILDIYMKVWYYQVICCTNHLHINSDFPLYLEWIFELKTKLIANKIIIGIWLVSIYNKTIYNFSSSQRKSNYKWNNK